MLEPAIGSSEIITVQVRDREFWQEGALMEPLHKTYQYGFAEAFWNSEDCYSPLTTLD